MKDTRYKQYLLVTLLLIQAFIFAERTLLGLVLQDIKVELDLSDTQLGLLSGIAFAFFYTLMGIPIARWADRGNRITLITITTALWGAAMVLCGMVGSFVQLLLVRVGVAVGEAGSFPAANSLIADHFTRAERPRATSIFMLNGALSMALAYLLGGWLNELYGWRVAFIAIGVPGLVLALLAKFTLREPRVEKLAQTTVSMREPPKQLGAVKVLKVLWQKGAFKHLLLAHAVLYLFNYGVMQWFPSFFVRSHGMPTDELGVWLAVIWGVGGSLGIYLGGVLASRYATHNEPLQLRFMAVVYSLFAFANVLIYLSADKHVALGLMALSAVVVSTANGPIFAIIQTIVPAPMRATAIALLFLFANLIGMGFGPLAVGMLSDALMPVFGQESLRYALVAMCPGFLWVGLHMWMASKTVHSNMPDVESADERSASSPDSELCQTAPVNPS